MWMFISSHNSSQDFTFRCVALYQYVDPCIVDYCTYHADFHITPDDTEYVWILAE